MVFAKVEHYRDQVIGLRPVYTDTGTATQILLEEGEPVLDSRRLKSTVKAFARTYAVDLKAQQLMLRKWIDRKLLLPFFLGKDRIFIPLKMRQTITTSDATYGYIDVNYIADIKELEKRCCLAVLTTGISVEIYSSCNTVIQNQHIGLSLYESLHKTEYEDGEEDSIINSSRILARTLVKMSRQLDKIEDKLD